MFGILAVIAYYPMIRRIHHKIKVNLSQTLRICKSPRFNSVIQCPLTQRPLVICHRLVGHVNVRGINVCTTSLHRAGRTSRRDGAHDEFNRP